MSCNMFFRYAGIHAAQFSLTLFVPSDNAYLANGVSAILFPGTVTSIYGDDVLPGFSVKVDALWEDHA